MAYLSISNVSMLKSVMFGYRHLCRYVNKPTINNLKRIWLILMTCFNGFFDFNLIDNLNGEAWNVAVRTSFIFCCFF